MAATISTIEPATVRAGETLTFKRTLGDYPAATWSITYSFRCRTGTAISFTSAADGSDHLITVAFGITASWEPGIYDGVGIVSDGVTAKAIWEGKLEVLPDLASTRTDFDARTQSRRTLDNINAVLEGRATSTILNSVVDGTALQRIPMADLLMLKDRYTAIVQLEEQSHLGIEPRNIFTRFRTPT